jgi:large subunit ribosomal protein L6
MLAREGREIRLSAKHGSPEAKTLLGTTVAHLKNMIKGSLEPFVKKLIIEGIGFKADIKGTNIVLSLGFSHPVNVPIPSGVKVVNDKGVLSISGADIEAVGSFAATIRALKKPEPYKGKGIRYEGEVIRRKQGKKTT